MAYSRQELVELGWSFDDACDYYLDYIEGMYDVVGALVDERNKLRELIRDMWHFTGTACKKYPRLFDQSAQGGQMVMPNMLDSFEQRMDELGIEVDE